MGKYELPIVQLQTALQDYSSVTHYQLIAQNKNLLSIEPFEPEFVDVDLDQSEPISEDIWESAEEMSDPPSSPNIIVPRPQKSIKPKPGQPIIVTPVPQEIKNPLREGQMDYMIPDKMEVGKFVTCIIRLGDKEVKNIQIGDSDINVSKIEISDEMSVKLIDTDENFKITPITSERQALLPGEYTEWKIKVKPLTIGTYPMLLRISCHFNGRTKDVEVLEKSITVTDDLTQPINRKKIVFVAAGSKSGLLLGKESNEIWEELVLSPYRDDFAYVKYFEVSNIQFNRALSYEKPTVVHFSGHGSIGGIFLADDNGDPILATNDAMSAFFNVLKSEQSNPLECVVLNACVSRSLADLLIKSVPIVIGTNSKISDAKAIRFSEFFYRSLGKRKSYREAFASGRMVFDESETQFDEDLVICLP